MGLFDFLKKPKQPTEEIVVCSSIDDNEEQDSSGAVKIAAGIANDAVECNREKSEFFSSQQMSRVFSIKNQHIHERIPFLKSFLKNPKFHL